jgi:TRAP-type C4-dicarboxylate transport system substrate-binding protein
MSTINLSDKEQQLLIELLEEEVIELREEILHTDDHEYREFLKEKENSIKEVLKRLKEATAG